MAQWPEGQPKQSLIAGSGSTTSAPWLPACSLPGCTCTLPACSHPDDPPSVRRAREVEVAHMRRWVAEYRAPRSTVDPQQQQQQQQWQLDGPGQLHVVA